MSGTTISSVDTVGIVLTAGSASPLVVTATGSIYVVGGYASAVYSAINAPATIVNYGEVYGGGYGLNIHDGGTITNGSLANPTALMAGGYEGILAGARALTTITNFGTIASTNFASGNGVDIGGAAVVNNGAFNDTAALIAGYFDGVFVGGAASVANRGTISAVAVSTQLGDASIGVYLRAGGTVTNGGVHDSVASISGVTYGVEIAHSAGVVVNFGTIRGTGPIGRGIKLVEGGTVSNGNVLDTTASIVAVGKNGVYCGGSIASTVTNMGSIVGGKNGVALQSGGTVVNGARTSTSATISGARQGVYIEGLLPSFVANSGTIASTGGFWGVAIYLRGTVANGGPTNPAALISGGGGVYEGGFANVLNYGTISGTTRPGVDLREGGELINYGTVTSGSGTAVYFGDGNSRLNMAPGAVFGGVVHAGTGSNVLDLMAGGFTGTLSGIGTSFVNFGRVLVDSGADWLLSGTNHTTTLTDSGSLTVSGSLDVSGTLSGDGVLAFAGNTTIEVAAALATSPDIQFLSHDTLVIDTGEQFGSIDGSNPSGPALENFGPTDTIDLRDLPLAGVIVLDYFAATGELRIGHGSGNPVAVLMFDPTTLGPGGFHIGEDQVGGALISHY